ncbi:hypothetical protein IQ251_17635 [Saccharopolyspora sp. HNM0983]|uniref:Uncharacterized protein n=1 Tax=Saccharopolyspora montiporae TaxID=2781240 RepID=A0A929BAE9_9PSEU|nr:hypothetical protein [Saccharopolyspora sp. HNM0983]MBE9376274.1 hypothetical protein [Saccharopolyspora sp. HNM0983]
MTDDKPRSGHTAGAFDVRTVIALLFAIYGAVLVVVGLVEPQAEVDKTAGMNINLWSGAAMLVFAGSFFLWAWLRPVVVPEGAAEEQDG